MTSPSLAGAGAGPDQWAASLNRGDAVIFSQRRGPAAGMFLGAVVLLATEVAASGLLVGANAYMAPSLAVVMVATVGVFVPMPLWRLVSGRPRLEVSADGIRYGRFVTSWAQVGTIRRANGGHNVEICARGNLRRFPLDNRLTSELMRRLLRARGSWLSHWMNVDGAELVRWLDQEKRARRK